jgi:hypothetical protein
VALYQCLHRLCSIFMVERFRSRLSLSMLSRKLRSITTTEVSGFTRPDKIRLDPGDRESSRDPLSFKD